MAPSINLRTVRPAGIRMSWDGWKDQSSGRCKVPCSSSHGCVSLPSVPARPLGIRRHYTPSLLTFGRGNSSPISHPSGSFNSLDRIF
jgi:hypothetical protein